MLRRPPALYERSRSVRASLASSSSYPSSASQRAIMWSSAPWSSTIRTRGRLLWVLLATSDRGFPGGVFLGPSGPAPLLGRAVHVVLLTVLPIRSPRRY